MRVDADQVISRRMQGNVPRGTKIVPRIGDRAMASVGGKWPAGWRMVGLIAPNAIIARDGAIREIGDGEIRCAETYFGRTSVGPGKSSGGEDRRIS